MPVEALQVMAASTRNLVDSDLARRAIGPNEVFPSFELPSHERVSVSLPDLLAKGPMVATVYRGVW